MEIEATPDQWAINDEQAWATFLATETGKRFFPKFLEYVPQLLTAGETNAILIRTGEVSGFRLAAQALSDMARPHLPQPTATQTETYPAPENDAAWNDGQKLEPVQRNILEPNFNK